MLALSKSITRYLRMLAQLALAGEPLPPSGPLPPLLEPPSDPVAGHPGDLPVA